MPNWKNIVSSSNSKQYKWPSGWHTRDQIAEDLECSRDRVSDVLAPAIEQGLIERKSFPVWEPVTRRKIMVVGYREIPRQEQRARGEQVSESRPSKIPLEGARVMRRSGSGKIGILSKEKGKWKITWPHRRPSYPSKKTLTYGLKIL